jgi:glucokinase
MSVSHAPDPRAAEVGVRHSVGVDLGGTKMAVGVVDTERRILHRSLNPTAGLALDELLDRLTVALEAALEAVPTVEAIGLGVPCVIDQRRGVATGAVNLPIRDLPLRELMGERLGLPVAIDNDANVAALAEHRFGAARGTRNSIALTIGTGVGGGVVIDGGVFRGTTGAGPELGHVVIDSNGPPCQGTCPNQGCLETMASGTALGREGRAAAEAHPESALARTFAATGWLDGPDVTQAALAGDDAAREVVTLIGSRLGIAVASFANAFEPEVFVIGGGVAEIGEMLLAPAREELRRRALPPLGNTPVVPAALGPDAGIVGAATLALDEAAGVEALARV